MIDLMKKKFYLIQIYGSGKQTRSFQYVSDLVDGLIALMNSNYSMPMNIGNPDEYTIEEFAIKIKDLVGRLNSNFKKIILLKFFFVLRITRENYL